MCDDDNHHNDDSNKAIQLRKEWYDIGEISLGIY